MPIKAIHERMWKELREQRDRTYKENQEQPYTVQIKQCDCISNVNRFLSTIPGKSFIDIKQIKDNWYLVVYKEYE